MTFTLVFFAFVLAGALVFVFRPLAQPRPSSEMEEERRRGAYLREKLAALHLLRDLEFDYQSGKLAEVDCRTARAEAEARVLAALDRLDPPDAPETGEGRPEAPAAGGASVEAAMPRAEGT